MISIIVPTFNSEAHAPRCFESVLRQTHRDLEVVAMDGGSTDGTLAYLRGLAERDPRVRVWSEKDRGVYDAYNQGIVRASGRWLLFLGSDDELHAENTLAEVSAYLTEDYDLVYGNVLMCGNASWAAHGTIFNGAYTTKKLGRVNISHQALFYRRDVFERFGRYDLRYPVLADWAFNLKVFPQCRSRYMDLVVARFHAGGLSTQQSDPAFEEDYFDLVREFYDFAPFHPVFTMYAYRLPRLSEKLRRERRYGRALQYLALHWVHTTFFRWRRKQWSLA